MKKSLADGRAGVDLDAGQPAEEGLGDAPKQLEVMGPEPVREAVPPDGVQAGVGEQDFDHRAGSRVAVENRLDIGTDAGESSLLTGLQVEDIAGFVFHFFIGHCG